MVCFNQTEGFRGGILDGSAGEKSMDLGAEFDWGDLSRRLGNMCYRFKAEIAGQVVLPGTGQEVTQPGDRNGGVVLTADDWTIEEYVGFFRNSRRRRDGVPGSAPSFPPPVPRRSRT